MPTPHQAPVRVPARELPRLLCLDSRCGLEGHEDDGLSVRRADRAHARGQVREEVHCTVRAAPHDEWAGERRRQEEVDAPVVRLDVQVEQSTWLDFVLQGEMFVSERYGPAWGERRADSDVRR